MPRRHFATLYTRRIRCRILRTEKDPGGGCFDMRTKNEILAPIGKAECLPERGFPQKRNPVRNICRQKNELEKRTNRGYSIRGGPIEKDAINSTGAWIVENSMGALRCQRHPSKYARSERLSVSYVDMLMNGFARNRDSIGGKHPVPQMGYTRSSRGRNATVYDTLTRFSLGGKGQNWFIAARDFLSSTGTIKERFTIKSVNI